MLNPIPNEAIFSATYVDNYLDSVENLPDDVQKHLSRIRDIDVQYRSYLRDIDHYCDLLRVLQSAGDVPSHKRTRALARIQQCLIQAQDLSDEKMQIVYQMQELIDSKNRQLDVDQKNLDIKEDFAQQHRLEQLQQQSDNYCGGTPQKQSRLQSPSRSEQSYINGSSGIFSGEHQNSNGSIGGGKDNSNSFSGFAGSLSSGCGGGSTPNSERSGNASNSATGSGNANGNMGGNGSNSNLGGGESQRTTNKRTRRRTEHTNSNSGNMELGGNESNSANEAGSSGGGNDRVSLHKSSNLGSGQKKGSVHNLSGGGGAANVGGGGTGAGSGGGGSGGSNSTGKKKKRKARGTQSSSQANAREETPPPDPIDPDEPTYCVCNQISFGEMILCDNDLCPIEWFHFSCVALVLKPKGKWYCPNCRGDRVNVMKPKAQFLKELERYNKEKEEKT